MLRNTIFEHPQTFQRIDSFKQKKVSEITNRISLNEE